MTFELLGMLVILLSILRLVANLFRLKRVADWYILIDGLFTTMSIAIALTFVDMGILFHMKLPALKNFPFWVIGNIINTAIMLKSLYNVYIVEKSKDKNHNPTNTMFDVWLSFLLRLIYMIIFLGNNMLIFNVCLSAVQNLSSEYFRLAWLLIIIGANASLPHALSSGDDGDTADKKNDSGTTIPEADKQSHIILNGEVMKKKDGYR